MRGDDLHPRVRAALGAGDDARVRRHEEFLRPVRSPSDFAALLGYVSQRIVKTILVADAAGETPGRQAMPGGRFAAVALSNCKRINHKAVAGLLGWRRARWATPDELCTVTDYPRLGMAPLGLEVPLLLDRGLLEFDTLLVGGGAVGVEVELSPARLIALSDPIVAAISEC